MGLRSGNPDAEPETRKYLIEQERDFMHLMVSTLIEDGPEFGRYAHDQLAPNLHALESGQAVSFHRFELPDGHRLGPPDAGHPCDTLELGEDNVVRDLTAKRAFWGRRA